MSSMETDVERSSSSECNSSSNVESFDSDGDSKAVAGRAVNPTDLLTTAPYSLTPVTDGSQKKNEYNLACKLTESTAFVADDTSSTETDFEPSLSPEHKPYSDVESSHSDGDSKAVAVHAVNPTDCCEMPTTTRVTDDSLRKRIEYNRHYGIPESSVSQFQNLEHIGSSGSNLNHTVGNSSRDAVNPAGCRMPTTSNFSSPVPCPQIPLTHRWRIPTIDAWNYYLSFHDNLALHNNVSVQNIWVVRYLGSGFPYYPLSNSPVNVLPQPVSCGEYSGGQAASVPAVNSADSGIPPRNILTIPPHLTQVTGSQNQMIGSQPNRKLLESNMLSTQHLGHTGSLASSHPNSTQGNSSKTALKQPTNRSSNSSEQTILESTAFLTDDMSSSSIDVERSSSPEHSSSSDDESSDLDGKAVVGPTVNPTDCCDTSTTAPCGLTPVTVDTQKNESNRTCKLPESTAFVNVDTSSPEIDVERSLSPERKPSKDVESSDSDGDSEAVAGHAVNPTDCCEMPTATRVTDDSLRKRIEYNRHYGIPESTVLQAENLGYTGSSGSNLVNHTLGDSSRDAVNPAGCRMPTASNFRRPVPYPQIPLTHRLPITTMAELNYYRGFYDNLALHNNVSAQNIGVAHYSGSCPSYCPQSNSLINVLPQPVSCGDYSGVQAASGPAANSAGSGIPPRNILTTPHHLTQAVGSQNQMIGDQPNPILSAAALRNRIRRKIKYTTSQLEILEKAFQENSYPSTIEKEQIAEKIGAEVRRVQHWFYNRRSRAKRN